MNIDEADLNVLRCIAAADPAHEPFNVTRLKKATGHRSGKVLNNKLMNLARYDLISVVSGHSSKITITDEGRKYLEDLP